MYTVALTKRFLRIVLTLGGGEGQGGPCVDQNEGVEPGSDVDFLLRPFYERL